MLEHWNEEWEIDGENDLAVLMDDRWTNYIGKEPYRWLGWNLVDLHRESQYRHYEQLPTVVKKWMECRLQVIYLRMIPKLQPRYNRKVWHKEPYTKYVNVSDESWVLWNMWVHERRWYAEWCSENGREQSEPSQHGEGGEEFEDGYESDNLARRYGEWVNPDETVKKAREARRAKGNTQALVEHKVSYAYFENICGRARVKLQAVTTPEGVAGKFLRKTVMGIADEMRRRSTVSKDIRKDMEIPKERQVRKKKRKMVVNMQSWVPEGLLLGRGGKKQCTDTAAEEVGEMCGV